MLFTVTQLPRGRMSSDLPTWCGYPTVDVLLHPRDLAPKDRNGASDPFVRVRYNGRTQETSVRGPVAWGAGTLAQGPIQASHCLTTASPSPERSGWECHLTENAEKSGVTSETA